MPTTVSIHLSRTEANAFTVKQIAPLFRTRVGLVLGPGAVYGTGVLRSLSQQLADSFAVPIRDRFDQVGDEVLSRGISEELLRKEVHRFITSRTPVQTYHNLTSVGWTAVLSCCLDTVFDDGFRSASERRLMSHEVNVVTDFSKAVAPRTVPVFKLLGSVVRNDGVISTDTYSLKRATWLPVPRALVELTRGAPILCLGMSDCPWVLWDLLGMMGAQATSSLSSLVLLADDPLAKDHTLRRLLHDRTALVTVDTPIRILLEIAAARQEAVAQQVLPLASPTESIGHALRSYSELVVVVGDRLESDLEAGETNQLHELLFSPSQPRWDAFAHSLDFPRSLAQELLSDVELFVASATPSSTACVLCGGAASGKTTLLKRLAFDIANRGQDVLWMLTWFYQDTQSVLVELFKEVARVRSAKSRLVVFMDDPIGSGTLTAQDVVNAAESSGINILLVTSARTSEWKTHDTQAFIGSLQVASQWEIPDILDAAEWDALPGYLVTLGVFADHAAASQAVGVSRSRRADDILTMLYWMVPATRLYISQSIRDEYFRLGDSAALTRVLVGDVTKNSGILQRAYELIAVAEHHRTSLPIEVLVSALDVRYDEWLDASSGSGPAWGLFYADYSSDGEAISYRTRNSVVTDVIIKTINGGGAFSHSGELRALTMTLAACTGTRPVYREFCMRILVPSNRLERFEYLEGLSLYEAAGRALPYPDRTLEHHRGLWIKKHSKDPLAAKAALLRALETPVFPYASHGEPDEHIFTSLAATELDAINKGVVDPEEGKQQILNYLDRAHSKAFFNPNAVHVEARLMLDLIRSSGDTADRYALINRTVGLLDRTMLMLRTRASHKPMQLNVADDIALLERARASIMQVAGDVATLPSEADHLFDTSGRQDGFILVARTLYQQAVDSQKGTKFNSAFEYCQKRIEMIAAANAVPKAAFLEVILHIYYHWRIVRRAMIVTSTIDWALVKNYCDVILRSTATPDPFHEYVFALSLAHLDEWATATAMFTTLRRHSLSRDIKWALRDFLLSKNGTPRRVQGEIKRAGDQSYLYVSDLHIDFVLHRAEIWPKEGETAHAYISFSFAGPTATKSASFT